MNEENKNQPEKSGLDDKKKTALLRYMSILFAVAFLLVLYSMLAQMRNSQSTISELNQSSASALQKAELLQEENRTLEEKNAGLQQQLDQLQKEKDNLQDQLNRETVEDDKLTQLEQECQEKIQSAEGEQKKITQAYEELLSAMELSEGSAEGNVALSKALDNLTELKSHLGQKGLEYFETLMGEGE